MGKYAVYLLAAMETAALLYFASGLVLGPKNGADNGSQAMAFFFYILLPFAAIVIGIAAFHYGSVRPVRGVGLALLILPLTAFSYVRLTEGAPTEATASFSAGEGIFAEGPPTTLAKAIAQNDLGVVTALAPAVKINEQGKYGYTFLTFAMAQPAIDNRVVAALLKAGADPNGSNSNPVIETVFASDAVRLNMLLNAGANPNPKGATGEPAMFNMTERPEMMRILLRRGAYVNATDRNGWTMVMTATRDGHWSAVDVLLENGADLRHKAPDGKDLAAVVAEAGATAKAAGQAFPPPLLVLKARVIGQPAPQ